MKKIYVLFFTLSFYIPNETSFMIPLETEEARIGRVKNLIAIITEKAIQIGNKGERWFNGSQDFMTYIYEKCEAECGKGRVNFIEINYYLSQNNLPKIETIIQEKYEEGKRYYKNNNNDPFLATHTYFQPISECQNSALQEPMQQNKNSNNSNSFSAAPLNVISSPILYRPIPIFKVQIPSQHIQTQASKYNETKKDNVKPIEEKELIEIAIKKGVENGKKALEGCSYDDNITQHIIDLKKDGIDYFINNNDLRERIKNAYYESFRTCYLSLKGTKGFITVYDRSKIPSQTSSTPENNFLTCDPKKMEINDIQKLLEFIKK